RPYSWHSSRWWSLCPRHRRPSRPHDRGSPCRAFPMDAEVSPNLAQHVLADRAMLRGLQKLGPESPELFVRDLGQRRICQRPPADARSLFELAGSHVAPVKIEEIEKSVLVQLVLDVPTHHFIEEPLGLRLESKGIQQLCTGESAAQAQPDSRIGDEQPGATPVNR